METFNEFSNKVSVPEKNTGSIISHAFEIYKGIFIYALAAIVIYSILSSIGSFISGGNSMELSRAIQESNGDFSKIDPSVYSNLSGLYLVSGLLSLLLAPIFVGLIFIASKYHNGLQISIGDLFIMYRQNFVQILLYTLIMNVAIAIGLMLCVLPALFIAPFFMLGYPILLFENVTAMEAVKKTFEIVKANYATVLGTTVVGGLISFSGILLCGVGVLLTALFSYVVMYSMYCAFVAKPRPLLPQ